MDLFLNRGRNSSENYAPEETITCHTLVYALYLKQGHKVKETQFKQISFSLYLRDKSFHNLNPPRRAVPLPADAAGILMTLFAQRLLRVSRL